MDYESAMAFECAEYILNNDREKEDFLRNPNATHIYYKALYAIEGVEEANDRLYWAQDNFDRVSRR